mmetsp:Transcript_36427/g.79689  ORF Transcript_36427/g.79689 Transcript_36427/m.79689 type:complete len:350 (+) Transcript_36427:640-1689(+)
MRDVVIRHRQDGELRDGAVDALDSPSPLIDRGQIRVHVTGVTTPSWHLLSSCRDLSKGICVRGHVRKDDEDVLLTSVGEVLRRSQRQTRRDDALNGGIVGQVHEQHDVLHGAVLLEVVAEESRGFHVDAHGAEDNAEIFCRVVHNVLALNERRLSADLCGDLVVWQTGRGEQRKLLTSDNGVHHVDGANASLDHLLWVHSRLRVQRSSVDVAELLGKHSRTLVDGLPGTIESTAHQIIGDWHLQHVASELDVAIPVVDVAGALKHLDNGLLFVNLQDLSLTHGAIGQIDVHNLTEHGELHIVHDDQRALYTSDGPVVHSGPHLVVPGGGCGIDCCSCSLRFGGHDRHQL